MHFFSAFTRAAIASAVIMLAGCAAQSAQQTGNQSIPAVLAPHVKYTFQVENRTNHDVGWNHRGSNCMTKGVPDVDDLKPNETVSYVVDTNTGCCRCSHQTSWFVLRFNSPSGGDYRDVGFDKAIGKQWEISNRSASGNLYFCELGQGGASIRGYIRRGTKCH